METNDAKLKRFFTQYDEPDGTLRPYEGIKLRDLEMTCGACPAQWEGHTEDGTYVYIRYRSGRICVDWVEILGDDPRNWGRRVGDYLDGYMDEATMLELTGFEPPTAG